MTYAEIDRQICEAICLGAGDFAAISARCAGERDRIALHLGIGPSVAFRIVDLRLRALRRRGVIQYQPEGGWQVDKEAQPC